MISDIKRLSFDSDFLFLTELSFLSTWFQDLFSFVLFLYCFFCFSGEGGTCWSSSETLKTGPKFWRFGVCGGVSLFFAVFLLTLQCVLSFPLDAAVEPTCLQLAWFQLYWFGFGILGHVKVLS